MQHACCSRLGPLSTQGDTFETDLQIKYSLKSQHCIAGPLTHKSGEVEGGQDALLILPLVKALLHWLVRVE